MSSEVAEAPQELIALTKPCITTERNLLNEARIEGFKTIEQAEAFLRRENHTLVNPMDERAIIKRVEILREEIEAAQEKQANDKLSTENINCIEVPKGRRLVIECIEKLIKENINNYTKEEINKVIMTDIAEHFELTNKDVVVIKQSFKAMVKNIDLSRKINVKKESEVESTEVDPQDIDFDEHDISPELIEKAESVADRILSRSNPIRYILRTIEKTHIGDTETERAIAVSIAGQSCLNTAGIQIAVNGASGSGKSDGFIKHLHLVPNRWKRETTLSAKAIFYMNIRAGMMIFSDDTDMEPDMADIFKQSTTKYQKVTYRTTVKDQTKLVVSIPPRINWYLTSVESHVSDQVLNRRLTLETDDRPEQKTKIFKMQKSIEASGNNPYEVTFRVLVCRRIYTAIKEQLFNVSIPFAEKIKISDITNSRIFPLLCDMIKGFAILNYKQREIDAKGNLIAGIKDFEEAKKLFKSRAENTVTKLTTPERLILRYIIDNQGDIGCTLNEVSKGIKMGYKTVVRLVNGRIDRKDNEGGLLSKVKGMTMEDTTETTYVKDPKDPEGSTIGSTGRKAYRYKVSDMGTFDVYSTCEVSLEE